MIYLYIQTYTCKYIYMYIRIYMYIHILTYDPFILICSYFMPIPVHATLVMWDDESNSIYICTYIYEQIYICAYTYIYSSIYIHTYIYPYIYIYTYIDTRIYTCRQANRSGGGEVGGWGRVPFSRNFMKPTPRRKWYLTTGRRFH